jgi:hypothetical protein
VEELDMLVEEEQNRRTELANNPFYSGWEPSSSSTTSTPNTVDQLNNAILYSNFVNQTDTGSNDTTDTSIGELDTHYRSGAKKYGQGEKYPINKLIGLPSTYASLGSYNYEIDPNTLDVKVEDTYDWNPAYGKNPNGKTGWVGNKKGKDVNAGMLKNYLMEAIKTGEIDKGDALELIGNYFGPKARELDHKA